MINDILNYWYKIEYFTPCWPIDVKRDINLKNLDKIVLPWMKEQNDKKIKLSYDLYFGKIKSIDLIKWMLNELHEQVEERIEPDNSITCIFAFKVDEKGYYVDKSFSVSSFVWAVCALVSSGSIRTEINPKEVKSFEEEMNLVIIKEQDDCKKPLDKLGLENLFVKIILRKLKLYEGLADFSLWARKKTQYVKKDGSFSDIDPATELFQSFYLNDIKRVIDHPSPKINEYVLAGVQDENKRHRILIDSDVQEMKKCLAAYNFPLGLWPGEYNPSLMQQIGINICTKGNEDIFSINGPPGTGKTTLLKEIVASNVIERARLLIDYDKPDDAFSVAEFKNPCDQYNCTYYRMDERLKKYGIIVASNNNAAVENISLELPKIPSKPKDRTERFFGQGNEISNDVYFSDVASELIGKPAWGLVSAKLGKKENLKKLKERLWWAKDGITLKRYYEEEVCDWNSAREKFELALKKVLDERKQIIYAQKLTEKGESLDLIRTNLVLNLEKYKQMKLHYLDKEKRTKCEYDKLSQLVTRLNLINVRINSLNSSMSFFQRFLKSNSVVKELRCLRIEKQDIIFKIAEQKKINDRLEEEIKNLNNEILSYRHMLDRETEKLNFIKDYNNVADDKFWADITKNEKSQASCPWVYERYNEMREELFYQALQVNKAFVLSSKHVKQNLQRLFSLWDGKYSIDDCKNSYGDLLNTLLLVIPVISTTFASTETFLSDIQQDELGLLIVDEAGQATPQSALGALWRCKRAIIVGDPLQVEPVLTVPKELIKRFADEYNISAYYKTPEISVQKLADDINLYGGYRNVNGEKIWLGCPLVVHRRCLSPMFEISNEVAYENKMFSKTNPPKEGTVFVFEDSVWFDIKGRENGNKDHTVKNQIDFTRSVFKESIEVSHGFPNMYIITPFKRVADNLRKMMRSVLLQSEYIDSESVDDWIKEHCGTVHTFQGKEAREVILVLGCDNQSGKGAAQWVGQKPNIINVAVSRAQFRIAVVGDYDLWKNIPNVQVICKYLEDRIKSIPLEMGGLQQRN
ncbi:MULTISPECIES: ATP-binding protein [unclassified Ruminococcus]|uniref:DEAD/DEAH box helicase n=1 Tax=unclassified Ruminococcus TaxID=2608920 RepID=UPI00210BBAE4|nr:MULTISPECIES: AAA domain-containing protein [unclassified Ruminococcus]MCQ4022615.1 hypothetical protein [Ruminococcus sp. zg-924]MCQ4114855.1 hypothetical protein [Ruminococcus sp. zg-921]